VLAHLTLRQQHDTVEAVVDGGRGLVHDGIDGVGFRVRGLTTRGSRLTNKIFNI